jgi:hypothetical protein
MNLLCAALLAFSGVTGGGDAAPRRLGFVVIPDLRATLGRVEQMAAVVSPGTLVPGALTAGLGAQIGDPGLGALGPGPVVLALYSGASPAAPPSVAAFVPTSSPEPYEKALKAMGWTATVAPGLVMGHSPKAAPPRAEDYPRVAAEHFTGDLRLSLNAVEVMDVYGKILNSSVDAMAASLANTPASKAEGAPRPVSVARILQLEMRGLLMMLEQTESVVMDMGLKPDALVTETVIGARPGSALAELATQPAAGASAAAAFLSDPAVMTATYQLDAARVSAFVNDLLRRAAADPHTAELATPELQALLDLWGRGFTGEVAMAMRAGTGTPLVMEGLQKVRDEPAALAFLDKGSALLAPGGAWAKLYADMGIPMQTALRKNVRRHAGAAVHRLEMKVDTKNLSPEQQAQFGMFLRDMDLAFARGYLLMAQGPQALDALLDRVGGARPPAARTLQAARAFGPGAHLYVDYDVFGLLRAVGTSMPGGTANPFAALPPTAAHPLLYAGWLVDGRLRVQSRLPLQPIADMIKAFQKEPAQKTDPARKVTGVNRSR